MACANSAQWGEGGWRLPAGLVPKSLTLAASPASVQPWAPLTHPASCSPPAPAWPGRPPLPQHRGRGAPLTMSNLPSALPPQPQRSCELACPPSCTPGTELARGSRKAESELRRLTPSTLRLRDRDGLAHLGATPPRRQHGLEPFPVAKEADKAQKAPGTEVPVNSGWILCPRNNGTCWLLQE